MVHILRGNEIEVKPVEWLWKPMIPFGDVTIVQGDGGDGKTTMMLKIAAMLSRGEVPPSIEDGYLIEQSNIEPLSTFFLTSENKAGSVVVPKFENEGGDSSMLMFNDETNGHMTLTKEELTEAIEQTGARLIIIDPLQAFLPSGVNLGNITKIREIFTMLTNVAEANNCAIVIIGHLNKNEHSRAIHRGLGSVDIAAVARSILLVEADKRNEMIRYVRNIKCNYDGAEHARILLHLDENHRLSFREAVSEERRTQIDKATVLLYELLQNGAVPVSESKERCSLEGISSKTAQRAKQQIGAIQKYIGRTAVWELPTDSLV